MFILVQLPLADLRPLIKGQLGRLRSPDWSADDPGPAFVRGFGKVAARNSRGYGLMGERFFADFNSAVRLRASLAYRQDDWPMCLEADLKFRRLYFDGVMAGRFEFGFFIPDEEEAMLAARAGPLRIDPRALAACALALPVGITAPGCEEQPSTIGDCSALLCEAYVAATTTAAALNAHPPAETCARAVSVGLPLVHVRLSNGVSADAGRDQVEVEGSDGRLLVTSAAGSRARNVVVCLSESASQSETADERAVRVVFSHFNSLLYAQSRFLEAQKALGLQDREPLQVAVADMIDRLERFAASNPAAGRDKAFAAALQAFGSAHTGRAEALQAKLERIQREASRPGPIMSLLAWTDGMIKHAVEATAAAVVDRSMKGG